MSGRKITKCMEVLEEMGCGIVKRVGWPSRALITCLVRGMAKARNAESSNVEMDGRGMAKRKTDLPNGSWDHDIHCPRHSSPFLLNSFSTPSPFFNP